MSSVRRPGPRVLAAIAALALWAPPGAPAAEPSSPAEIRKEMSRIRAATNWDDPAQAAAAEAKLKVLRERLRGGGAAAGGGAQGGGGAAAGGERPDYRGAGGSAEQFERIAESAASGGKLDLAKISDQVLDEELAEERNLAPRNAEMLARLDTLVLDLSTPEGKALAERLDAFRGVRTLVVTGGASGAPVALDALLARAAHLPLEDLSIVGFRAHLTALSPRLGVFTGLRRLALYGNALTELPPAVGGLSRLEELLLDLNPIATVLPVASRLPQLSRLGIGKTRIGEAERAALKKALPRCRIEP